MEVAAADRKGGADFELTLRQLRSYRDLRYRNMDRLGRELMKQLIFRLLECGGPEPDAAGDLLSRAGSAERPLTAADIYMTLDLCDQMFYTKNIVERWMENAKMPHQLAMVARMDAALALMRLSGQREEAALIHERYMALPERPVPDVMMRLGCSSNAYYRAHDSAVSRMSLYLHDCSAADLGGCSSGERQRAERMIECLIEAGRMAEYII